MILDMLPFSLFVGYYRYRPAWGGKKRCENIISMGCGTTLSHLRCASCLALRVKVRNSLKGKKTKESW